VQLLLLLLIEVMYIMLFQYFKDKVIENLWHQVKNIEYHVDENNEFIITRRLVLRNGRKVVKEFKKGTKRCDVWEWFDDNYSKGVEFLLYGD